MFDRNDLDLRISAHQDEIETINRTHWQTSSATPQGDSLRRQFAAALVALAAKLDGAAPTPMVSQKASGSYMG